MTQQASNIITTTSIITSNEAPPDAIYIVYCGLGVSVGRIIRLLLGSIVVYVALGAPACGIINNDTTASDCVSAL